MTNHDDIILCGITSPKKRKFFADILKFYRANTTSSTKTNAILSQIKMGLSDWEWSQLAVAFRYDKQRAKAKKRKKPKQVATEASKAKPRVILRRHREPIT